MMEEFSFPTVAKGPGPLPHFPFPHFVASSRWFVPSDPAPARRRRSFSYVEAAADAPKGDAGTSSPALSDDGGSGQFSEYEERMDMLWEDFNEELRRVAHSPAYNSTGVATPTDPPASPTGLLAADVEPRWPRPSKNCRVLHHRRRPSLLVMVKVLKKLFLVQRSPSSTKASHCHV